MFLEKHLFRKCDRASTPHRTFNFLPLHTTRFCYASLTLQFSVQLRKSERKNSPCQTDRFSESRAEMFVFISIKSAAPGSNTEHEFDNRTDKLTNDSELVLFETLFLSNAKVFCFQRQHSCERKTSAFLLSARMSTLVELHFHRIQAKFTLCILRTGEDDDCVLDSAARS